MDTALNIVPLKIANEVLALIAERFMSSRARAAPTWPLAGLEGAEPLEIAQFRFACLTPSPDANMTAAGTIVEWTGG